MVSSLWLVSNGNYVSWLLLAGNAKQFKIAGYA